MTFERTWVLIFLLLPLGWMFVEWRRTRRITALVLKTLAFLAIVLALAEPTLTVPQTKMAVAVLVDTSSSVSAQDLARASEFASALDKARGRHWVRVLPFARSVRDLAADEQRGLRLEPTAGEAGRATDLESGIEEAISSLPSDLVPRIVLVSDGKENAGSITRAAWQAQRLGIPIDTVALAGRPQPTLRLESVTVPTVAFTGEQFPVDLSIVSPSAVSGSVQISAEGKVLGSNPVKLEKGDNQVRVHASLTAAGALSLAGVIQADGLGRNPIRSRRHSAPSQGSLRLAGSRRHRHPFAPDSGRGSIRCRSYRRSGARHACRLSIGGLEQPGHGIAARRAKRRDRKIRAAGRRPAGDRRRTQCLRRRQEGGRRARSHSARQARSAAIARRHRRGADHRQIFVHGRQENRAGAPGRDRRGGESASHRFGGRADLRQLLSMGRAHSPRRRQGADQAPDFRNCSRRRHPDCTRAGGGVSQSAARARHVQAHRVAHRRHLGRGRQSRSFERGGSSARDHLHRGARPGREPRVSGKSGFRRRRQIVLLERARGTGADCAQRRDGAHRFHRRRKDVAAVRREERRNSGRRGHRHRAARSKATCGSSASRPRTPSSRSTRWIRCWCAGSTAWAAPWSLPPMRRAAGRPTG